MCVFLSIFTPSISNTSINFLFVDASQLKLCLFLSFFLTNALLSLLNHYLNVSRLYVVKLFWHAVLLGYGRPKVHILSLILFLVFLNLRKIDNQLSNNLFAWRNFQILLSPLFQFLSLKLVCKSENRFCKIHPFGFLQGSSVNDCTSKEFVYIR